LNVEGDRKESLISIGRSAIIKNVEHSNMIEIQEVEKAVNKLKNLKAAEDGMTNEILMR
jgi:hypothetical protein